MAREPPFKFKQLEQAGEQSFWELVDERRLLSPRIDLHSTGTRLKSEFFAGHIRCELFKGDVAGL